MRCPSTLSRIKKLLPRSTAGSRSVGVFFIGVAILLYACAVAGRFGERHFFLDLLSHFVLQYLAAGLAVFVLALVLRRFRTALALVPLLLWCGYSLTGTDTNLRGGDDVRGMEFYSLNANIAHPDPAHIVEDVRRRAPTYVAIMECSKDLYEKMRASWLYASDFRHEEGVGSVCFFTNAPIREGGVIRLGKYPVGSVTLADGTRFFIVHPLPPVTAELHADQLRFFRALATKLATTQRFVVLGDFNSTVYSPTFAAYFGRYAPRAVYSWNVSSILRLPIDYVFSNRPLDVRPLPDVGSDHIPLLIDFSKTMKR